jgi:hypothetical protein
MTPEQQHYGPSGQVPPPPYPPINDNTKTLGIVSIICAFLISIVGLVIAIIGSSKAKQIQRQTGRPAEGDSLVKVGLILSIIMTIIEVLIIAFFFLIIFVMIEWEDSFYDGYYRDPDYTYNQDVSDHEHIILGRWDCGDATPSIHGYQFDNDGNIVGHDGSKQNPEITRFYEFSHNGRVYAHDIRSRDENFLRGIYTASLFEIQANGHYEYELSVTFSEFVGEGETYDEFIGQTTAWGAVVDPSDRNSMGLSVGGSIYKCLRAN